MARTACFTAGTAGGLLSSLTPSPTSTARSGGIGGELAADADPAPVPLGGLGAEPDQAQHGRLERVRERRDLRVAALGRHRVLGEVVRADREEVDLGREAHPPGAPPRGPRP